MIDLTKARNYYVACGYTDLRPRIDGLAAVVTQQYSCQRTDRIRALYWTGDGHLLFCNKIYYFFKKLLDISGSCAIIQKLTRQQTIENPMGV